MKDATIDPRWLLAWPIAVAVGVWLFTAGYALIGTFLIGGSTGFCTSRLYGSWRRGR